MSLSKWREAKLKLCTDFPEHLFYFAFVNNFENILKLGILPQNEVKKRNLEYTSFAETEVQLFRSRTLIYQSGHKDKKFYLHDFVPLYFTSKTPTLYKRKEYQKNFLFFKINSKNLIIDEQTQFAFCDGNAGSLFTKFYHNLDQLNQIDWKIINAEFWNKDIDGKRRRNAEFLIYQELPLKFIDEIILYNNDNYDILRGLLNKYKVNINLTIDAKLFF